MKKTALIAGVVFFLLFTTSVNAQVPDTTQKQPVTTEQQPVMQQQEQLEPVTQQPTTTTEQQQPVTAKVYNDQWNNWDKSKYAMLPMPEPLTTEKIFPAIGNYQLTDKEGTASQVTVTLDPSNKGVVWVEGLPQGKFKAILRKSPATYKIPAQKLGEEETTTEVDAKETKTDVKTLPEGVLIYDKDANTMNVCVGCKYNTDDPATAFNSTTDEEQQATDMTETKTKTKKSTTKTKTKVAKVKPILYSGSKTIQETTTTTPTTTMPSQEAPVH